MLLNSSNIAKFITESDYSKRAQVGIDLSVCHITKIIGGSICKEVSSISPYEKVDFCENHEGKYGWVLGSGVYSLTFNEYIRLDSKHTAFVHHRSSLLRCGAFILSGVYDPGFKSQLGATMFVKNNGIFIEKNARIAQIIIHENQETEVYSGQYQGEKDKK